MGMYVIVVGGGKIGTRLAALLLAGAYHCNKYLCHLLKQTQTGL